MLVETSHRQRKPTFPFKKRKITSVTKLCLAIGYKDASTQTKPALELTELNLFLTLAVEPTYTEK